MARLGEDAQGPSSRTDGDDVKMGEGKVKDFEGRKLIFLLLSYQKTPPNHL